MSVQKIHVLSCFPALKPFRSYHPPSFLPSFLPLSTPVSLTCWYRRLASPSISGPGRTSSLTPARIPSSPPCRGGSAWSARRASADEGREIEHTRHRTHRGSVINTPPNTAVRRQKAVYAWIQSGKIQPILWCACVFLVVLLPLSIFQNHVFFAKGLQVQDVPTNSTTPKTPRAWASQPKEGEHRTIKYVRVREARNT